jgi:phage terminase small subunit
VALTPKRKLFVQEYLKDLNAAGAYKRAGFAVRNDHVAAVEGARLLTNPDIAAAVTAAQAARARKLDIDAAWVLRRLVRNANRAAQAVPVRDRDGNATGEYEYQGAVVNKSLELIGKHVGMFRERVEHEHSGTVTLTLDQALAADRELEQWEKSRGAGEGAAGG